MSSPETPLTQRASLPAGWEPLRDLVLLLGRGAGPRAHALRQQGQERILVWLPPGAEPEADLDASWVVRSGGELVQTVLGWPVGTAPRHLVVQRTEDPEVTEDLQRDLARRTEEAAASHHVQSNTVMEQGSTWLRQGLENLGSLGSHPPITPLFGRFQGWPAICISPGPSLARNVGLLREVQDRALLIAGTHSLTLLQKEGVRPHLVVLADAGDLLRHLDGYDVRAPEAFLVGGT